MKSKKIIIRNKIGIHARPAAALVSFIDKFDKCKITISNEDQVANGKNIMQVFSLHIMSGDEIEITVDGENEDIVLNEIIIFIKNLE